MIWSVSTFYFFKPLAMPGGVRNENELLQIEKEIFKQGQAIGAIGLFILGTEGLNSTFACPSKESLLQFQNWVVQRFAEPELMFKDSESAIKPFEKLKIRIRPEIVTLGTPELSPTSKYHRHLTPEEWDRVLDEDKDLAIIDTRNSYEYRVGTFQGAIDPKIEQFGEFPEFIDKQDYAKDKKILIFCTGGIRCEKGILELERRGYNNVYQLEGGIINYLKRRPQSKFEGECFVFDNRVALKQDLTPTESYKLCPHCGQPADIQILCERCGTAATVCCLCRPIQFVGQTCTKNCAHHYQLRPGTQGRRQKVDRTRVRRPKTTDKLVVSKHPGQT